MVVHSFKHETVLGLATDVVLKLALDSVSYCKNLVLKETWSLRSPGVSYI